MSRKLKPHLHTSAARNGKPLVLVVEDHEDTRSLLKYLIEAHGYSVIEAADGEQAVILAERLAPDLILMDSSLPLLDGLGATRRIRQLAASNRTPIIFVSGYSQPEYRAAALAAGGNDYFVKPLHLSELEQAIEEQLERVGPGWALAQTS